MNSTIVTGRCETSVLTYFIWGIHCLQVLNIMIQYAGFELRRSYFPLLVLFRKWGEKVVCLRKWWDRCCMRCIVKYYVLTFIEWISIFIVLYFKKVYEIIFLRRNIHYLVVLKFSWFKRDKFLQTEWVCLRMILKFNIYWYEK